MTEFHTTYKKSSPYNYNYFYHRPPQRDRKSELFLELQRLKSLQLSPAAIDMELSVLAQRFGIKKITLRQMLENGFSD